MLHTYTNKLIFRYEGIADKFLQERDVHVEIDFSSKDCQSGARDVVVAGAVLQDLAEHPQQVLVGKLVANLRVFAYKLQEIHATAEDRLVAFQDGLDFGGELSGVFPKNLG